MEGFLTPRRCRADVALLLAACGGVCARPALLLALRAAGRFRPMRSERAASDKHGCSRCASDLRISRPRHTPETSPPRTSSAQRSVRSTPADANHRKRTHWWIKSKRAPWAGTRGPHSFNWTAAPTYVHHLQHQGGCWCHWGSRPASSQIDARASSARHASKGTHK